MARPTKYKRAFCKIAEDYLAQGYSKEACAGELGVSRDTLYEWIKRHTEFSDSIKKGEAKGLAWYEKLLRAKISGQDIKGFDPKKSDTACLIFALKTRFHQVYGDRIKFEDESPHMLLLKAMGKID